MRRQPLLLIAALGSLGVLAACGRQDAPSDAANLAARQAELEQREAELAAREAALVAEQTTPAPAEVIPAPAPPPAAAPRPATPPPARPAPATRPPAASTPPRPATPAPAPAPVVAAPRVLTVPAGTQLPLSLTTALSTKNAKVGDTVRARVTSDVVVDGGTAIAAGATVAGQVIQVVSGSSRIGGVPTLGIHFDRIELPGGVDVPVSGEITQSGRSDTGRDTAKIVGGAAAGVILGNEIKGGDKGKVLGGLLGGAIGAVAAQKTGTEVELGEGTALTLALAAPVDITK